MSRDHDSRSVANELLNRGFKKETHFTPMSIIKLVYFCHAWMLGIHEKPIFKHEVRAWIYGPVIREVYWALKNYRANSIEDLIFNQSIGSSYNEEFDEDEVSIIDQVFELYGRCTPTFLSTITHQPGTPWDKIWKKNERDSLIPNSLIQKYYAQKIIDANR